MKICLDQKLFSYKDQLLKDLYYLLDYADELKKKTSKLYYDNLVSVEVSKWFSQRESLQETCQSILVNAKEEWRLVLPIVSSLVSTCLDCLNMTKPREPAFDMTMNLLRSISLCISPKRMARYWPTEVHWLLKVTEWTEEYLSHYSPHTDYTSVNVLILWLAAAVKTPFDLSRFDQNIDGETVSTRLTNIIVNNISNYSLYSVVHLFAAAFYSRPDCNDGLGEFIEKLLSNISSSLSIYSNLCALRILASLLKTVPRVVLLRHVDKIFMVVKDSIDEDHEQSVKLSMKVLGRSMLVHLKPPKQVKWRYRCGKRVVRLGESGENRPVFTDSDNDVDELDLNTELPDYFENLIQILLENLVHKCTVVRFSVAKYLAAISNRLPYEYSDQILHHIFELCGPTKDDNYWHGSCLAIAEFVRRGFVPVNLMDPLVGLLEQALFFEQIKGSYCSGAHVRDAACYICWSMARAYDGSLISPYVLRLAPKLLNVACFDREVSCRRASSAVIQELSGRTQQFPHWIDVIRRTEFHELIQIEHTYTEIGAHFAISYVEFREAMVENLLFQKCVHWDPMVRHLSSQTVAKIANKCPFYGQPYCEKLLEKLEKFDQMDWNYRHGIILALSNLLNQDTSLQKNSLIFQNIFKIFLEQSCELQKTKNSFGSNLIREALLVFVDKCLILLDKNDQNRVSQVYSFLMDSLRSNDLNESNALKIIPALLCFVSYLDPKPCSQKLLSDLIEFISCSSDHSAVSIVAQFFSKYKPAQIEMIERLMVNLNIYFDRWFGNELRRPETIADIVCTMLALSDGLLTKLCPKLQNEIHQKILKCLDDHTITKKGDTGQLIRKSTIKNIFPYASQIDDDKLIQIIQLIASEAASHRERTFLISMNKIAQIVRHIEVDRQETFDLNLKCVIGVDFHMMEDVDIYQKCIDMFQCTQLIPDLWRGFVLVLADPILDRHSKLISNHIQSASNRNEILSQFLMIAQNHARCQRLSLPCLISAHLILTRVTTNVEFQENLAKFAWKACEKTCNPKKYILACDVFCALLALGRISLAQSYLYVLLGHRLPRVRSYTATQLYTSILSLEIPDEDHSKQHVLDEIGLLLQKTNWNDDLNESKNARNELKVLMQSL